MKTDSLILVGTDPRFIAVATEAARMAFPGAPVTALPSLDEALKGEQPAGLAVLVLSEPTDADVARAARALDPAGLARWAVVLLRASSPEPGIEFVAPGDWNAPRAERAFRSSTELHRLRRENAALRGDLLTIGLRVVHDLRTPLGCIAVATEALKDFLAEAASGELGAVRPIVDSTDELAGLIRQFSVLAKATARPVPQQPVDMGAAAGSALERLQPAIQSAGASVSVPSSWPTVVGDGVSLEAVWLNLLSNALRHSGGNPRVELGWSRERQEYCFWVLDHGPGVPPRIRGLLFQPFNQLHVPSATRGLGLSVVQRLVQLQGGRCGYEPQPSGGSRFFFTLPAT